MRATNTATITNLQRYINKTDTSITVGQPEIPVARLFYPEPIGRRRDAAHNPSLKVGFVGNIGCPIFVFSLILTIPNLAQTSVLLQNISTRHCEELATKQSRSKHK